MGTMNTNLILVSILVLLYIHGLYKPGEWPLELRIGIFMLLIGIMVIVPVAAAIQEAYW